MPQPKVTLKIPKPLYDHIKVLIEGSGFNSVTDFVVFVLRDIIYEGRTPPARPKAPGQPAPAKSAPAAGQGGGGGAAPEFSGEELEKIKQKLRNLGYL
jgi:hypothetical protein